MSWPRYHRFYHPEIQLNACSSLCMVQDILLDETFQRLCILYELTDTDTDRHSAIYGNGRYPDDGIFEHSIHSESRRLICIGVRRIRINTGLLNCIRLEFLECIHSYVSACNRRLWYRRFWQPRSKQQDSFVGSFSCCDVFHSTHIHEYAHCDHG